MEIVCKCIDVSTIKEEVLICVGVHCSARGVYAEAIQNLILRRGMNKKVFRSSPVSHRASELSLFARTSPKK